jgi:hypothetical protein
MASRHLQQSQRHQVLRRKAVTLLWPETQRWQQSDRGGKAAR